MTAALAGRAALVTGAAGDIGRAIAIALAEAGADVAAHDREHSASLAGVAAEIAALGRKAITVAGDVRDAAAVQAFVGEAIGGLGRLDILVNNAGIMTEVPLLELGLAEWRETLDTNLTGCFLCSRAVVPHMIARKAGAIVNIASQLAYRGGSPSAIRAPESVQWSALIQEFVDAVRAATFSEASLVMA